MGAPSRLSSTLVLILALLAVICHAQQPQMPPPPFDPDPAASPSPLIPVRPSPTAAAQIVTQIVPTPSATSVVAVGLPPTLFECRFVIRRMTGLLLFEMLLEFVFLVLKFLVFTEVVEWELNILTISRSAYTLFVVLFNFTCIWWGSGPKGSCTFSACYTVKYDTPKGLTQRRFVDAQ